MNNNKEFFFEETLVREVAFLDDMSGRRRFLETKEGKLYWAGTDGKEPELVDPEMLASALSKHEYALSGGKDFVPWKELK